MRRIICPCVAHIHAYECANAQVRGYVRFHERPPRSTEVQRGLPTWGLHDSTSEPEALGWARVSYHCHVSYETALEAFRRGDNVEADRLAQLDLATATESGDTAGGVNALCMLARTALRAGRLDDVQMRAVAAQGLAGDEIFLSRIPLHLQAVAARMAGRDDDARELYRRSIDLNDALGEVAMAAAEHRNLAYVEVHAGNHDEARGLFAESRRRLEGVEAPTLLPYLTLDESTVAFLDGDLSSARARLDDAEAQFAQQGVVPDPDDAAEISWIRQHLTEGKLS